MVLKRVTQLSHLDLVLVVQDFKSLSIFDNLGALLQFELQKGVRDDTDSNINCLDIVLDLRDGLLDVGQWCVV